MIFFIRKCQITKKGLYKAFASCRAGAYETVGMGELDDE